MLHDTDMGEAARYTLMKSAAVSALMIAKAYAELDSVARPHVFCGGKQAPEVQGIWTQACGRMLAQSTVNLGVFSGHSIF